MKVAVLGAGAWGTAIAQLLADNNHEVSLWCYEKELADEINNQHTNHCYLPEISLRPSLHATADIVEACKTANVIFEAIPVQFLRKAIIPLRSAKQDNQSWVVLSKGIEKNTLLMPREVILDVFGKDLCVSVLAGPSFAGDLARKCITAVNLACKDTNISLWLKKILQNSYFKVEITSDVCGVEIAAAFKNVMALGLGVLDGACYSNNTKALFFTKALEEIKNTILACNGNQNTAYGLAGLGDLFLTASSIKSRNMLVGQRLGKGEALPEIVKNATFVPESINTVDALTPWLATKNIQAPLAHNIALFVQGKITLESLAKSFTIVAE